MRDARRINKNTNVLLYTILSITTTFHSKPERSCLPSPFLALSKIPCYLHHLPAPRARQTRPLLSATTLPHTAQVYRLFDLRVHKMPRRRQKSAILRDQCHVTSH